MPILGYVNLTITAGGKDTEIPFAITKEGADMIIIGSPGLRALDFTLKSPRFKNVNYLQPPNCRQKHNLESSEALEAEQREGEAPMIAPKLVKQSHQLSKTSKQKSGKKKSAASETEPPKLQRENPSSCSSIAPAKAGGHAAQRRSTRGMRAAPPKADSDSATEQKVEASSEKTSGRAAGKRKNAKPAKGAEKAKTAPTHSDRVRCEEELKKDEVYKVLEQHKHVELSDDGNIVPAPTPQDFRQGGGTATARLKRAQD
jgi:hypothetical protein